MMSKHYRIIFESYEACDEQQQVLSKTVMMEGVIEKPEDVFNGSVPFLVGPFMHKFRTLVSPGIIAEKASLF